MGGQDRVCTGAAWVVRTDDVPQVEAAGTIPSSLDRQQTLTYLFWRRARHTSCHCCRRTSRVCTGPSDPPECAPRRNCTPPDTPVEGQTPVRRSPVLTDVSCGQLWYTVSPGVRCLRRTRCFDHFSRKACGSMASIDVFYCSLLPLVNYIITVH